MFRNDKETFLSAAWPTRVGRHVGRRVGLKDGLGVGNAVNVGPVKTACVGSANPL